MPSLLDNFKDDAVSNVAPQVAKTPTSALDAFTDTHEGTPTPVPADRGAGQAALEGFGQTATMGYLPQIQATAETGVEKLAALLGMGPKAVDQKLQAQGFNVPQDGYLQNRDANIQRQSQLSDESPWASGAGKLAGIAATAAMPLGAASKGASLLSKVGRGAAMGAAQGAAYNPGDTQGEISPVQAGPRAINAGIGGAVGGALSGIGAGVSNLADKSRMVDRIKDSASLSPSVKSEIDQALEAVTQNQVKPRADQLADLLKGKTVQVNPERLKGVDPRVDRMVDKFISPADEAGLGEVSAKNAQRFKRVLDSQANYAKSKPFDPNSVARGEEAKTAADVVRSKLSQLDPNVDKLNSELGEIISKRNALADSSSRAPISSIRSQSGTDKNSLIDAIDQMAGSKLEGLAGKIDNAKDMLLKPSNLVKPLEATNEIRKLLYRGAAGTSRGLESATPAGTQGSLQQALMEALRKK